VALEMLPMTKVPFVWAGALSGAAPAPAATPTDDNVTIASGAISRVSNFVRAIGFPPWRMRGECTVDPALPDIALTN
jgi:hypothetical protein